MTRENTLKVIEQAKKKIIAHQKKIDGIYLELLKKLDVKKHSTADDFLWDYVYNDCYFTVDNVIDRVMDEEDRNNRYA